MFKKMEQKTYLFDYKEITEKFILLSDDLENLIAKSDFKINFFLEKLNLKRTTFYNKRKNLTFTPKEVLLILELLDHEKD